MNKLRLSLALATLALGLNLTARADQVWSLDYTAADGSNFHGFVTLGDQDPATLGYAVTELAGTYTNSANLSAPASYVDNPDAPLVVLLHGFVYDNVVYAGSSPLFDSAGLLFSVGDGFADHFVRLYSLEGDYFNYDNRTGESSVAEGQVRMSYVPDGGQTFGLLGLALVGLTALRRKFVRG